MMSVLPTLSTSRLILRPFALSDGPRVRSLAGDRAVAQSTANIPHPYPEGAAEKWIASHPAHFANQTSLTLALARHGDPQLIGAIALEINRPHNSAELGYWIGKAYWNQGYCTEAARGMLSYGFENLGLHRIQARHMTSNPASGRVMEKIGLKREGILRHAHLKWGEYHDYAIWSILESEFRNMQAAS